MDAHEFQLENTGGTDGLHDDDDGVQVLLFLAQVLQGELEPFIGSALAAQQDFLVSCLRLSLMRRREKEERNSSAKCGWTVPS